MIASGCVMLSKGIVDVISAYVQFSYGKRIGDLVINKLIYVLCVCRVWFG
jgi:hypothetical protein